MPFEKPDRLAVLIDGENISAKYAGEIIEQSARLGSPGIRRLFCNVLNPGMSNWQAALTDFGLLPVHSPCNSTGKNASDIALVIDAMDLLHSGQVDGFVLVSSDGDFTRLAIRIREQGLSVIGIGESKAPVAFQKVCDQFIELSCTPAPKAPQNDRQAAPGSDQALHQAYQLIRNAIEATDSWLPLTVVGNQLNKRYPDFDPRNYGHKKLSDLIRETARFEIAGEGATLRMRHRG